MTDVLKSPSGPAAIITSLIEPVRERIARVYPQMRWLEAEPIDYGASWKLLWALNFGDAGMSPVQVQFKTTNPPDVEELINIVHAATHKAYTDLNHLKPNPNRILVRNPDPVAPPLGWANKHKHGSGALEVTDKQSQDVQKTPNRVALERLEASMERVDYFTAAEALSSRGFTHLRTHEVLTICVIVMKNGFAFIGKSAPADLANFDAEFGKKLAYDDAVRQIWPMEGYLLRTKLHREATSKNLMQPAENPT